MKLPQLSLRDLFWLVALVAMGCGWAMHWARTENMRFYKARHIWMENKLKSNGFEIEGPVIVDPDGRQLR